MKIEARLVNENTIEVMLEGQTRTFPAWKIGSGDMRADKVFAAPVVRRGKDWPVSVLVRGFRPQGALPGKPQEIPLFLLCLASP